MKAMGQRARAVVKALVPERYRRRARSLMWRVESVWGPVRGLRAIRLYRRYQCDLRAYRSLPGAERTEPEDLWPCLFERTETTPFDAQYFYQDCWAARQVLGTRPACHVDVGSRVDFVGMLSASVPVIFLDIRPLTAGLPNLQAVAASVLELPFADESVASLSCLHVIEHVGLGRYGDPLDPRGTEKAARELARVLGLGGNLFVGTPVGRERVCFNAHRVHWPQTILRYFEGLKLLEFSCVVGNGVFREKADPLTADLGYGGCGLFWFTKDGRHRTKRGTGA